MGPRDPRKSVIAIPLWLVLLVVLAVVAAVVAMLFL